MVGDGVVNIPDAFLMRGGAMRKGGAYPQSMLLLMAIYQSGHGVRDIIAVCQDAMHRVPPVSRPCDQHKSTCSWDRLRDYGY